MIGWAPVLPVLLLDRMEKQIRSMRTWISVPKFAVLPRSAQLLADNHC